ncbi:hypothetical protein [Gracilibacillus thailandensis]|uniref:Uncharacterized protein n=1 Tax=Gracilibacillus thailandensis TaxID=563735 RepID=A0A6N7R1D4_9BACI|nr:hypothetical protein [Gracilibacillus thailandensis]MRI67734.1 hypothetical protein [Gracilibacillus thailandensis]
MISYLFYGTLTLFISYRTIVHSIQTYQEGNKVGAIAVGIMVPIIITFVILILKVK